MNASQRFVLVMLASVIAPVGGFGAVPKTPVDTAGRPLIIKRGTVDCDLVETTPVVFRKQPYRFEWVRPGYWANSSKQSYCRFVNRRTGEATPPFAFGHEFGSAFVEGSRVYVTGTSSERSIIQMFTSKDLKTWESWTVFRDARFGIFNTSLCRAGRKYVLMFEIDRPTDQAGAPFTARFLTSKDLRHWELTPPECNYAKDRYTAPHCLRYLEGYFYDFYLEAHHGYETRVVRSRDLIHWEASPLNPVLKASDEDRRIANPKLPPELCRRIAAARNINNSDIDFCEESGRLLISYSWGNQEGTEFLAEATFAGTEADFLRGWFPPQKKK